MKKAYNLKKIIMKKIFKIIIFLVWFIISYQANAAIPLAWLEWNYRLNWNLNDSTWFNNTLVNNYWTINFTTDSEWFQAAEFNWTQILRFDDTTTWDYTISMWVKPNSIHNWLLLINNSSVMNKQPIFLFSNWQILQAYRYNSSTNILATLQNSYNSNEWIHIVSQRQWSIWRIYINWQLLKQWTVNTNNSTQPWDLWGFADSTSWSYKFNWLMRELLVYDLALTDSEIEQIYNHTYISTPNTLYCEQKSFKQEDAFPSWIITYPNNNISTWSFDLFWNKWCVWISNNVLNNDTLSFCNWRKPEIYDNWNEIDETNFSSSILTNDSITFNFYNYYLSWNKSPYLEITSDTDIRFVNVTWSWPKMYISTEPWDYTYEIQYNQLNQLNLWSWTYYINFEKDNIQTSIDSVYFWRYEVFNINAQVCQSPDTDIISIDWIDYNSDEIDLEALDSGWVINSFDDYIESVQPWFTQSFTEDVVYWEITSPNKTVWQECAMFSENWSFLYYSNWWSFSLWFSFESIWLPESVAFVWDSIVWLIVNPINSIISTLRILTPFTESTDWKKFCIMWTVMEYDNHKLFKDTEYYNKMWLLDYWILLGWFIALWSVVFGYKAWIWPTSHEDYWEGYEQNSNVIRRDRTWKKIWETNITTTNTKVWRRLTYKKK